MSITLGSSIASLRGQRQLAKTSKELGSVFERLSSGQRINRASDDAAGLAIADSLRADSRVLTQGVRNLSDGLALLTIADAAIESLSTIVIRLEELAEQSANGIYSDQQRKALDGEAQALSDEFFRISRTTEFNGQRLFTGESPVISLQAGAGEHSTIEVSFGGALGTGEFATGTSLSVGDGPRELATADVNSDGFLDILSVNRLDSTVSVLLGSGNGGFSETSSIAVGDTPLSISTGDFNNDGIIDFATADFGDATVSIALGIGNGSFQAPVSVAAGSDARALAVADFNKDGFEDIVSTDASGDRITILLNQGDGTFTAENTLTVGDNPNSVATGDFNNDGIVDVVTADFSDGTASILLGVGNGTFSSAISYSVGAGAFDVVVADFNNDQLDDIVTVNNLDDSASLLLGVGDGSFGIAVSLDLPGFSPRAILAEDFNGDGNTDLASAIEGTDEIAILIGDGTGGFDQGGEFAVVNSPYHVAAGDFDQDGVLDLLAADYAVDTVSLLSGRSVSGVSPLLDFSLATIADARQALPIFENKRNQLTAQRAEIGANQARIEVATNVLTVASENFRAAESRIRDADIAAEAANLTRLSILQQAASSILAQANQQPALALSLLT